MPYFFLLGQTPELSYYELEIVTKRLGESSPLQRIHPHLASIDTLNTSPQVYMELLGGTVKILTGIPLVEDLESTIATDYIADNSHDAFVISGFSGLNTKRVSKTIKEKIIEQGGRARFRDTVSPFESSGILSQYQEYIIITTGEGQLIGKTVAVQDINRWNKKDYGRPSVDPKSGMLPPKIARIMVNLAFPGPIKPEFRLLDPFCGSGTIVLECLDSGISAIGTDISTKAIESAIKNTYWFASEFKNDTTFKFFIADAAHISLEEISTPVDAIVFEGYLGPPNLTEDQIKNQYKGMQKLYTGVLKNLSHCIRKGGRVIIALPQFQTRNGVKSLDNLVDACEKFGYTQVSPPFTYGRDMAKVKRSIYILQKQ